MRSNILLSLTGLFSLALASSLTPLDDSSSTSLLLKRTGNHHGGGHSYCADSRDKLVYKNGHCACKDSKPSGWQLCQGPQTANSGKAVCGDHGCNVLCSGANTVLRDGDCKCKNGYTRHNGQCVPACSQYEAYDSRSGQCICAPSCSRNKGRNSQCEPSCGANEEWKNNQCKCKANFEKVNNKCKIRCDSDNHEIRKNDNQCKCKDGFTYNNKGKCISVCRGDNEVFKNGRCKCAVGFERKNGKCKPTNCGRYMQWNGYKCVCKPGCNSHGNTCNPPQCRSNEEYDEDESKCVCKPGFERTSWGFCVPIQPDCPKPNEYWNGEKCVCKPGCWRNPRDECEPSTPSHRPQNPNKKLSGFLKGHSDFPVWSKKHHTREQDSHFCPDSLSACPIPSMEGGYECVDTTQELENCGGCSIDGNGKDCTQISGVEGVGCLNGQCVVFSCVDGHRLSSAGVCVPSLTHRSL